MEGSLVIVARLINACWFCFKWGLVLVVVGGIAAIPFFVPSSGRTNPSPRRRSDRPALSRLERDRSLRRTRGGRRNSGPRHLGRGTCRGRTARGVCSPWKRSFFPPRRRSKTCWCANQRSRGVTIRRARRFAPRAGRTANGAWRNFFPPPKFGDHPPESVVENGTIEIFDPTKTPSGTLTLRDVNLTSRPMTDSSAGGSRDIRSMQGMLACDYFRRVEFQGTLDPKSGAFTFTGTTQGLEISPEFCDALPAPLAAQMKAGGGIRRGGEVRFSIGLRSGACRADGVQHRGLDRAWTDRRPALPATAD